jgi:transposase
MAYLGLVTNERTTGMSRRQGSITKCGNGHARLFLIEAAHHYRLPPKISKELCCVVFCPFSASSATRALNPASCLLRLP